ncbi:hypothetical protein HispidOSU_022610, partial [Sigmodon hispidus]
MEHKERENVQVRIENCNLRGEHYRMEEEGFRVPRTGGAALQLPFLVLALWSHTPKDFCSTPIPGCMVFSEHPMALTAGTENTQTEKNLEERLLEAENEREQEMTGTCVQEGFRKKWKYYYKN